MTLKDFRASIPSPGGEPPAVGKPLLALWFDARGDWERAHECAQEEAGRNGDWVHAYLHRKEGDSGNAQYWYTRAGRKMPKVSLEEEWTEIVEELLGATS